MIRHWDLVYENPPFSRDMALFALAVALHLPLFFIKMKSPPNLMEGEMQRVNVAYIERIERQVTIVRTPATSPTAPPTVNLDHYKKVLEQIQKSRVRALPAISPAAMASIKVDASRTSRVDIGEKARQEILKSRGGFKGPETAGPRGVGLRSGAVAGGEIALVKGPEIIDAPAPLRGRGEFAIGPKQIAGIGTPTAGGIKTDGMRDTAVIRMAKRAEDDPTVFSAEVSAGGGNGAAKGAKGAKNAFDGGGAVLPESRGGRLTGEVLDVPAGRTFQRPKFTITGPLKDRPILTQGMPTYPPALRAKGIEASVQLKFTVTPEGRVKDGVQVIRSSGYFEMDKAAIDAIRRWTFVPLDESQYEDQLGMITMNFSMK